MIRWDPWMLLKLIVAVVVILTLFRPASAGFGEHLSGVFHACRYSACDDHPTCPYSYDILTQTREGCSDFKQRNYCCPSGTGPQCFFTGCDRVTSCPGNYRELDRTKIGCSDLYVKAYCCKRAHLPYCFDMTCPTISESAKSCPPEFRETRREKGRSPGCDSGFSERVTCCLRDNDDDDGEYNRNYIGNTKNDSVVANEMETTLEDGNIKTFTRPKIYTNYKRYMYSSGETSFTVFLKVLILLPIIISIL